MRIASWQADALARAAADCDLIVLNCTNSHFPRRPLRNGLYYLLNILSLRSDRTRAVPLPEGLRIRSTIDFESEQDGAWQRLPPALLERLGNEKPDCLVKFGMGLLRVPGDLPCPILSYHHGDPRRFRGRPAGFYELAKGAAMVGQVVQILSDKLDSGKVVAFAETRVSPHSYKATMADCYGLSPLLLAPALRNALAGRTLAIEPNGKNYRLPSNFTVLRFAASLAAAKLGRLARGAFVEKAWQCASAPVGPGLASLIAGFPPRQDWSVEPTPARYNFLADPFPHPSGGMLVEAFRRSDGQGDIVHVGAGEPAILCSGTGHFSYPATIAADGGTYMVPEMAEWSVPRIYRLTPGGAEDAGALDIEGSPRVVDPTLFAAADGAFYLFGNRLEEPNVLRLWVADSLFGRFAEHPASPVRLSPLGGRMAGALFEADGRLVRPGQDYSRIYGDGVVLYQVTRLSRHDYQEEAIGEVRLAGVKGPHTLNFASGNFASGRVIFDFYGNRASALAWLRRLRSRAAKASAARAITSA